MFTYDVRRIQRLVRPSRYDHEVHMLVSVVGAFWLLVTGWKRDYRILGEYGIVTIALAHPELKLALAADGRKWQIDVVSEQQRDETLLAKGWSVRHYRFPKLDKSPKEVRKEVRRWYWAAKIMTLRRDAL